MIGYTENFWHQRETMNKRLANYRLSFYAKLSSLGVWIALLLLASGCANIKYDVHHAKSEMNELSGHNGWPFYHSPQTGEIVPKHPKHHPECYEYYEPPFFGYNATCWRRWPAGWVGCPIVEEEIILEEPIKGYEHGSTDAKHDSIESNVPAPKFELPKKEPSLAPPNASSRRAAPVSQQPRLALTPLPVQPQKTEELSTPIVLKPVSAVTLTTSPVVKQPIKAGPAPEQEVVKTSEAIEIASKPTPIAKSTLVKVQPLKQHQQAVKLPALKEIDQTPKTAIQPVSAPQPNVIPSQIAKMLAPSKSDVQPEKAEPAKVKKKPELPVSAEKLANAKPKETKVSVIENTSKANAILKAVSLPKTQLQDSIRESKPEVVIENAKLAPVVDNLLKASYTAEAMPKSISQMLKPLAEKTELAKEPTARTAASSLHPPSSRRRYHQSSTIR